MPIELEQTNVFNIPPANMPLSASMQSTTSFPSNPHELHLPPNLQPHNLALGFPLPSSSSANASAYSSSSSRRNFLAVWGRLSFNLLRNTRQHTSLSPFPIPPLHFHAPSQTHDLEKKKKKIREDSQRTKKKKDQTHVGVNNSFSMVNGSKNK